MKSNGLELKSILSQTESLTDLNDLNAIGKVLGAESYITVIWLDYAVLFGTYCQGQWQFPSEHTLELDFLQRLRVFNDEKELHVWKSGKTFHGRWREDGRGHTTDVVEAQQILYGTRSETGAPGYTLLSEAQRGIQIEIPIQNLSVDQKKRRVCLLTRNYIAYNPLGQAGYADCRFVEFGNY